MANQTSMHLCTTHAYILYLSTTTYWCKQGKDSPVTPPSPATNTSIMALFSRPKFMPEGWRWHQAGRAVRIGARSMGWCTTKVRVWMGRRMRVWGGVWGGRSRAALSGTSSAQRGQILNTLRGAQAAVWTFYTSHQKWKMSAQQIATMINVLISYTAVIGTLILAFVAWMLQKDIHKYKLDLLKTLDEYTLYTAKTTYMTVWLQ